MATNVHKNHGRRMLPLGGNDESFQCAGHRFFSRSSVQECHDVMVSENDMMSHVAQPVQNTNKRQSLLRVLRPTPSTHPFLLG